MHLRPVSLREANAYVAEHHRHSKKVRGHKYSVAVEHEGQLVGVGITGRPVSRVLDDGYTAEILRVCTIGHRNACSMLYGAARRAAVAMGYRRVITYLRTDEDGASVKAAGFRAVHETKAEDWNRPSRPRAEDHHEVVTRVRWEWP